ncbi:WxL protein peptidoglycan domain-containing protein [Streptomyces sp. NPDC059909]|uniref:WxL protein peptidoglycan domain-containing protein n=1 Tax=Streptomyces sp. NPDC059909 TaxID=3346998 RepID=UPI003665F9E3
MRPPRPRTTTAARSLARAAVVALLAVLAFLGTGAGPVAAADGDAPWAISTASNDFGSDRPNYSYTVNAGGHVTDALEVVNHGTTPLHLAVYAADAFTNEAGRLDLVAKDAKSPRVGAWVRMDRPDVTVGPGRSVKVPFTLTVPHDAAPGDYMGGIVTSPTDGTDAGRRLGIRIRLRVGGALEPKLSVQDLHVRYSGTTNPVGKGDATVTYTIRNTGNAILMARQTVSLSGPFGLLGARAGHVDDSPALLPGDTWKVTVPVHGVTPALRSTGTVTLVPLLTDASGSVAPLAGAKTTTHAWTVSWTLLLCLVVLCALVAAGPVSWSRRRRRAKGSTETASAEVEGDHGPSREVKGAIEHVGALDHDAETGARGTR